jgi:hypothetical protein
MSTYHCSTIDIPVRDDLVIPGIDYQCDISVDRNGDPVLENVEVSLFSTVRMNCFEWVAPPPEMRALIDADVLKEYRKGNIDMDAEDVRELRAADHLTENHARWLHQHV